MPRMTVKEGKVRRNEMFNRAEVEQSVAIPAGWTLYVFALS